MYKDSRSGQLPALRQLLQASSHEKAVEWSSVIDRIYPDLITVKENWDRLSDQLFGLLPERGDATPGMPVNSLRLSPLKKPKDWNSLAELEHQIHLTLGDVVRKGDKLIAEMKEDLDDYSADSLLTDLSGLFRTWRHTART